jgi:hypothetical protein
MSAVSADRNRGLTKNFPLKRMHPALCRLGAGLFGLAALSSPLHSTPTPIAVVKEGESVYRIVVASDAPRSIEEAATELQRDLIESTGAKLPIITEPSEVNGPYISLGDTAKARAAAVSAKGVALEGFRIATQDDNIYIIGPDTADGQTTTTGGRSNGTANGVYTFLEDYLGVRWLIPGDTGRDVPPNPSFTLEPIDRVEAPYFVSRTLQFAGRGSAVDAWDLRLKLGRSVSARSAPTWKRIVPSAMMETHPEWFPLIIGERAIDNKNYKLETTDPGLVRHFVQSAIQSLKANPAECVSLSPTDYPDGWSESEPSQALYDKKRWGYQVTTTLMIKFYHDVAALVAAECPEGRLSGYIYDVYKAPPTNSASERYLPLPTNFYPTLANNGDYGYRLYQKRSRAEVTELLSFWTRQSSHLTYYGIPNRLDVTAGIILPPAPGILNYLFSQLTKYPVSGILLYGHTSWSEGAITNYIDAKMMWNPQLDASDLQAEWLARAYGPRAGTTMNELYNKLDAWFDAYYNTNPKGYVYNLSDSLLNAIHAAHYPEIERLCVKAKGELETPKQRARFQLLEDNLILMQAILRDKKMLPDDLMSPLQRTPDQIKGLRQKSYGDFQLFPGKQA